MGGGSDSFLLRIFDPDLQESFQHCHCFPHRKVNGQIVTHIVEEYLVNFEMHINCPWRNLNKRYHQQALRSQGIVDVKHLNQATTAYVNTLQIPEDSSIKLRDIHHWNFVLTHYGAKQFNLAAQSTTRATYITVDTDFLHVLVKASIDKSSFGADQVSQWQIFTRSKPSIFKTIEDST